MVTSSWENNFKNKNLVLIYGNPGVGKSTLAKRCRSEFPNSILISLDHLLCHLIKTNHLHINNKSLE